MLATTFTITVLPETPNVDPVLVNQAVWAAATMFGYFALGVTSLTLIKLGLYRRQMEWIAVTGDCAFPLINIWVGLGNTGLDANYAVALPPIWLAPVVLSVGALRFNPLLQAFITDYRRRVARAADASGARSTSSSAMPRWLSLGSFRDLQMRLLTRCPVPTSFLAS